MPKKVEQVPAGPFTRWLNERLGVLAARRIAQGLTGNFDKAVVDLAREIGWDKPSLDAGVRRLYRYRHQQQCSSRGGKKGTFHAEVFPRAPVEEALHYAGVPFAVVYPELAAEEDLELEPQAYCGKCDEIVQLINGQCPWCEKRLGLPTGQKLMGKRLKGA